MFSLLNERKKFYWAAISIYMLASVCQYYYINRPGERSQNGDRYAEMRDIGKAIAVQSSKEEVVFLKGMKPSPEIVFYAGRNIKQVENEIEAVGFLQRYGRSKGALFEVVDGKAGIVRKIAAR